MNNNKKNSKTSQNYRPKNKQHKPIKKYLGLMFTVLFCALLAVLVVVGRLPIFIEAVYFVMSVVTFCVYAIDKSAAKKDRWRTKERTLHLLALLCGWPGAYFGQYLLRHKSSKVPFKTIYWGTVFINLCCLFWLLSESGLDFFI